MMKKKCLFLSLFLSAGYLFAQQVQETVYLHNGSIIKGEIIEQVPNISIKIRTADGNVFAFPMSDIEKISKEEVRTSKSQGRHRGLDFNIDFGYNAGVGDAKGGNFFSAEIGLGKRINKHIYLGIGSGAWIGTGGGNPMVPVSWDFKLLFPVKSSVVPTGLVRLGYVFNTAGDVTESIYGNTITIKSPDYFMMQIMPGIQIPLSKRCEFSFAAGYTHMFVVSGSGNSGYLGIKAGFNFHKSPIPRPKKPVRNRGLQFTLEGGMMFDINGHKEDDEEYNDDHYNSYNGSLICTYKLNPHFSVGIGIGVESGDVSKADARKRVLILKYGVDRRVESMGADFLAYKAFVRGQYRLTNRRFSPFVACDAGMRFYSYEDVGFYGDPYMEYSTVEVLGEPANTGLYAAPALGVSLRTANNLYLELKAGYAFISKISGKKGEKEFEDGTYITASCEPYNMSAPFATLGFTYTFGIGSK